MALGGGVRVVNDPVKARVWRDSEHGHPNSVDRRAPVKNYRAAKRGDRQRVAREVAADIDSRQISDCDWGSCDWCNNPRSDWGDDLFGDDYPAPQHTGPLATFGEAMRLA
jgi:hypothetical protein